MSGNVRIAVDVTVIFFGAIPSLQSPLIFLRSDL
jgi:hypothetical protein